jgi:hypothetical protein
MFFGRFQGRLPDIMASKYTTLKLWKSIKLSVKRTFSCHI